MLFKGNGGVWDKEKNKRLCKFVNGEFETEDIRTIEILAKLGYKTPDAMPIIVHNDLENDDYIDKTFAECRNTLENDDYIDRTFAEARKTEADTLSYIEMKKYCKQQGYTGFNKLNKIELTKFILEREE